MDNQPWRDHFAGGVYYAAASPLGTDGLPLTYAEIDRFQMAPFQPGARLVEIPPRYAVGSRDDRSVRAQQRRESLAFAP